ncbi:Gfo/Idh/MocA family oxidoreductase [Kribbella sp. NPDC050820]|uniref:Gfo/Idh/MocA family protein n=1 Tax=Kribbella sp. NPDC050820 TaxID=3155408 RepID=UPI0033CB9B51
MALTAAPADERRAIGFGLLGYGFMGKAHSNALHKIPYIFWPSAARPELVAIAGRTEAGVREAATRYGYQSYTTDWHDLLADERVDVFDNVGADTAHVEPTLAAIAAGKHVVCEKPLAATAADALRLYQAAETAGVKHLVCFNYRFFPAVRLAWELVHNGELGTLRQARFRYSQEWRTDVEAALPSPTGALDIIGSHAIDLARFLCGEITSVSAAISSIAPERTYRGEPAETDDTVAIVAELEDGLVATIDASLVAQGRRNHLAWELNGSNGALTWNLEEPNVLRVHRRDAGRTRGFAEVIACEEDHPLAAPWWPTGHVLGWEHGHINMLAHFCDAVANDTAIDPYGATFLDGLRVAQVSEAVEESAATGSRVAVAEIPVSPA